MNLHLLTIRHPSLSRPLCRKFNNISFFFNIYIQIFVYVSLNTKCCEIDIDRLWIFCLFPISNDRTHPHLSYYYHRYQHPPIIRLCHHCGSDPSPSNTCHWLYFPRLSQKENIHQRFHGQEFRRSTQKRNWR